MTEIQETIKTKSTCTFSTKKKLVVNMLTKKREERGIKLLQRSSSIFLLSLVLMQTIIMISTIQAFSIQSNQQHKLRQQQQSVKPLFSSSTNVNNFVTEEDTTNSNDNFYVEQAKVRLINTALRLKDEYGIFLLEKDAIDQLKVSLDTFDNIQKSSSTPPTNSNIQSMFAGEWELIVTTGINTDGITIPDVIKNVFNQIGPLKTVRDTILSNNNKFFKVQQLISKSNDQIDNIISFDPPNFLQEIVSSTTSTVSLPEQLVTFNINPLQVSQSKIILQHAATVDTTGSSTSSSIPFTTKLTLNKVIVNVAGTSTILDPDGRDLTSLPIPSFLPSNIMDIINPGGEFTTIYMDNTVRISKGKQGGFVEQLRIFLKKQSNAGTKSTTVQSVVSNSNSGIDVDDSGIDPEFDSDIVSPSDVEVL